MPNDDQLNPEDLTALMQVKAKLPASDPRGAKIDAFIKSQLSSYVPDANAQAKQNLQNIPQFTSPADQLRGQLAQAQTSPQYNDYMHQSGNVAATGTGGMAGGAVNLATKGLPAGVAALGKASMIGAGVGAGQLAMNPTQPKEALGTAAATTGLGVALSPVAKFIQDLGAKAKAGPLFKAVSDAAGENVVDTAGPASAAARAKELQDAGFSMPRVLNRFLARMKTGEPLTFDEARNFEQAAGGKLSTEEAMRIKPAMRAQLSQFAAEMRKATMQAAGQSGQADTFSDALNMYRTGAQTQQKLEFTKELMVEMLKKAGTAGAGAVGGYGAYKALSGKK